MITCRQIGGPERNRIAKQAVRFCLDKFFPKISDKIAVEVVGGSSSLEDYGHHATCEPQDWEKRLPREFKIDIDPKMDNMEFMQSLMHEMVHIKQYARGELRYTKDGHGVWNGYSYDDEVHDYYDLPWEIEAHGREAGLVYQFLNKHPEWHGYLGLHHSKSEIPVSINK